MLLNGERVSQFSGRPNVCTQSLRRYLLPTQCVTIRQSLPPGAPSLGRRHTLKTFSYNQMGPREAGSVQWLEEQQMEGMNPSRRRAGKDSRKQRNEVAILRMDRSEPGRAGSRVPLAEGMASAIPGVTSICGDPEEVRARAGRSQSKGEPGGRWGWKDAPNHTSQLRACWGFSWR